MNCPVIEHAEQVMQASEDMRQQFQAFREAMDTCHTCKARHNCLALERVNREINAAIEAVLIDQGWLPNGVC